MPKPNIDRIQSAIPDPMLSDNFQLNIPRVPGAGNAIPLLLQCRTAVKPGFTINNVEVQLFGHTLEHAGNLVYSHDLTVEYVENRSAQIHKILEAWGERIRNHETQHGAFKREYAVNAYLSIFDQSGATVREYTIVNMWPNTVPDTSFDGSASNIITLSVGFKYDYYEVRR